ncbi:MAG: putative Holliday junction resolvase [Flavobacteriales bacterium]|jgi:putative Holliday junction resolvase
MGRVLAIDYGTKRIGLAETDELQIIASGIGTIHSSELKDYIKTYQQQKKLSTIVIGLPKRLNNEATHATKLAHDTAIHLKRTFPTIEVVMIDERFTSKMASAAMFEGGLGKKKRQEKGMVDMVSATIILQSYMEQQRYLKG